MDLFAGLLGTSIDTRQCTDNCTPVSYHEILLFAVGCTLKSNRSKFCLFVFFGSSEPFLVKEFNVYDSLRQKGYIGFSFFLLYFFHLSRCPRGHSFHNNCGLKAMFIAPATEQRLCIFASRA